MTYNICIRFLRLIGLLIGPVMLALVINLLPMPAPVRAAAKVPQAQTAVQHSLGITVYLPIIYRAPTIEEQLIKLINAERSNRGLGVLSQTTALMQVAEAHSQDMVDRNFFNHINPDGLDPGDRLINAGYNWYTYGENIGWGYTSPQAMFNGWMNSSGHRANMLNVNFTEVGIGYVRGGSGRHYWTAVFARPWP